VYIHGGGFSSGDRSNHGGMMLDECLKAGISYASIDYRLSYVAPYPAPMLDGARAVQFIRTQAREWNVDPLRIAAAGNSAGSGITQWLAFHNDLADPNSDDPVARQSTRLSGALALCMQSTYDFREIRKIVPGTAFRNSFGFMFFGLPEDWDWDAAKVDSELDAKLKDASPIHHLSADDCPVYILHRADDRRPGNIHHPNFGEHLKQAMDKLGLYNVRVLDTDFKNGAREIRESRMPFLKKVFGMR
jgi:acetyl esterase/lipase